MVTFTGQGQKPIELYRHISDLPGPLYINSQTATIFISQQEKTFTHAILPPVLIGENI